MRAGLLVMAGLLVVASSAGAQSVLPIAAELREAKLMQQIGPQTRAWIAQEAAREAQMQELTEVAALSAVRAKAPTLGKLSGGDIDELVALVMMQAARDADEDLKTMLDDLQKINKAQAALGQSRATANASRRLVAQQPIQPRPLPRAEFDSRLAVLLNDKDGLEEMSGTEQLRLQMVTERRSRVMETLANLMKKLAETSASLSQNLP
jgi:hypothetical protein